MSKPFNFGSLDFDKPLESDSASAWRFNTSDEKLIAILNSRGYEVRKTA